MTSLTLSVPYQGELHRRICNGVRDRIEASKRAMSRRYDKWIKDEEAALAYLPEKDIDAARRVEREQKGKPQYTTLQIPYSYAVLMASHTYWTTVFLSRTPVFQYTGRHGESQQQVQAMEALIDYQLTVGKMLVPLYIWLMDAGKYGVGIVGNYWDEEFHYVSDIQEQEEIFMGLIKTGRKKKLKVTNRIRGYEGNKLFNVRPYDWYPDPRIPLTRFQEGEFCGSRVELGWNTILRRQEAGYYTNVEFLRAPGAANQAGGNAAGREPGSGQLELPEPTTYFFEPNGPKDGKRAEVIPAVECVIDLIPSQWGLGKSEMPEKWVFTVTSDYTVCLGAQPLAANHNKYPYAVLQLEPEGHALFGRGLPEILDPVQRTIDWLINSHFYNVRKTINNQIIVDPSRVVMKDFIDSSAGGMIRLKPSAYGADVRTVYSQVEMVDITRSHLADMSVMLDVGQRASGVSDQIMGMLNQTGRRSATEVRTSSTFGINRLKTQAEFFSATGWAPISEMFVSNSQQLYEVEMKLKIVGDLALQAGQGFINVTPEMIAGSYDFVPVDGTLPIDRFAQANLWKELLGQFRAIPELMVRYDIGRIFEWVAQLAGLKNITQFKVQVLPPGVMPGPGMPAMPGGNVVPIPGNRGPSTSMGGVPPPRQLTGMGPTG